MSGDLGELGGRSPIFFTWGRSMYPSSQYLEK